MLELIPSAEPFFFPGSKTGCLLIHGFTGAPKEMRWMGEYLSEQGYSVLGLRLAGHATHPEDMIRSRWADWLASVEDGYHLLHGVADHIYLIGLSMGGALALLMSTRLDTKGVIAISTPYRLHDDWRLRYTDLISKVRPFMPKGNTAPDPGWFDKEAWKDHISYSHNPVRSIGELNKLLMAMHTALPQVRVPVLLIHSKDDAYILPENLERIYIELTNVKDKSKLYVTGSGHVVTRDAARGQVFEATANFIRRVESKPK